MSLRHMILYIGSITLIFLVGLIIQDQLNPYILRVIINTGIAIILSLSLNLVNGCAGQFSLGHAGFMGVGAYVSAALTTRLFPDSLFQTIPGTGLAIILGGIAAGVAGYLVGLPSLRLKGDYLAIVTLGFGEIIRIVFLNIPFIGGAVGLAGIPLSANFFWVYFWVFVTFLFLFRLIRSSHGRAILAIREDELAAELMGIPTAKYKVIAFVLSSFFAGIAGGLFAHYQGFIDPNSFSFIRSVEIVIMVVLGGMGSLSGAFAGAIIVTVLPELLRVFNSYRLVIFPLLLIVTMIWKPSGLFGFREIWNFFKRAPKTS